MNQLFLDKLHSSMNDKNRGLLEAVELLYRTCEQKAQLESATSESGRFAFGILDEEGKQVLAEKGVDAFKYYVEQRSFSKFRSAFEAKVAAMEKTLADGGYMGMKLARVLVDKPDEKLVLLKEGEGAIAVYHYFYVARA